MKRKKIVIAILLLCCIFMLGSNCYASSKLNLTNLNYDVQLNEDGSANITETWNISVKDTNTLFKTFEVDSQKYSGITDVTVAEVNKDGTKKAFQKIQQEQYHVDENCYYALTNSSGKFEIAWGAHVNNTTKKTYEISYKVQKVVKTYTDTSEFYWQFISDESAIPADKVTGTIRLPNAVSNKDNLRVWGHGPLNGDVSIESNQKVSFQIDYLDANTFLEVRVAVLEPNIFKQNTIISQNKLDSILQQEQQWADEANEQREYMKERLEQSQKARKTFVMVGTIAGIIIAAFAIYKITRYHKLLKETPKMIPTQEVEYYRDLPNEKTTPGEATFLYHFKKSTAMQLYMSNVFSSTILDLCLKKYITFEIMEKDKIQIILQGKTDKTELKEHEKIILEILEKVPKEGENSFSMKELEKYNQKHATSFATKLKSIEENIIEEQEKEANYKAEIIKQAEKWVPKAIFYITMGLVLIVLAPIATIPLLIAGIYSYRIYTRCCTLTQKGTDEKELWIGLKKYMEDFSTMQDKEVPELILWEKYMVYATAFGIADKVQKQLKIIYPQLVDRSSDYYSTAYMYLMFNSAFRTSFITSFNAGIDKAYQTGVSSAAVSNGYGYSNSSSGGGFGGGFSGGGGFGGGGGRNGRKITFIIKNNETDQIIKIWSVDVYLLTFKEVKKSTVLSFHTSGF